MDATANCSELGGVFAMDIKDWDCLRVGEMDHPLPLWILAPYRATGQVLSLSKGRPFYFDRLSPNGLWKDPTKNPEKCCTLLHLARYCKVTDTFVDGHNANFGRYTPNSRPVEVYRFPKLTNEVHHLVRVLSWESIMDMSPLKSGVRLPVYIPRGARSGRSLQVWFARHRQLLGS